MPAATARRPGGRGGDVRRGAAAATTRGWISSFPEQDEPILLEINTLPGMKETSLLPMRRALRGGWDFTALVRELVTPALAAFSVGKGARPGNHAVCRRFRAAIRTSTHEPRTPLHRLTRRAQLERHSPAGETARDVERGRRRLVARRCCGWVGGGAALLLAGGLGRLGSDHGLAAAAPRSMPTAAKAAPMKNIELTTGRRARPGVARPHARRLPPDATLTRPRRQRLRAPPASRRAGR